MSTPTETATESETLSPPDGGPIGAAPVEPVGVAEPRQRIGATIREALRGSRQNYTQGPIGRSIVLLAVPMVLEMGMESLFAITDVFWVAHLGAAAVATVGLTESMLTLVYAAAMGLAMGAAAVVARRIGEQKPDDAARAAVQALALAIGIALVLGAAGALAAPRLLAAMGASPEVITSGVTYTRVMLGGVVSIVVLFVGNSIFRGAGDAAIAMRVLWIANAINMVLGPLLIFGVGPLPKLGVTGAAIATTIGRTTGACIALWRMSRADARVHVKREHLHLSPETMARILRLSGSAAFQALVGMASWIGLVRIISTFGSSALAAWTITMRIIMFALLPSWGVSAAAATMVGQALGAKNPDRAERAVWIAGRYNAMVLGVVSVLFVVFTRAIIGFFTTDPAVMSEAVDSLRMISSGFVFYAFGMVFTQAFNGSGDTWTPTKINIAVFWALEIPLAYVLAKPLGWGPHGVYFAATLAFCTLAVVSGLVFRRGTWKSKMV